jgi:hypothetical protein
MLTVDCRVCNTQLVINPVTGKQIVGMTERDSFKREIGESTAYYCGKKCYGIGRPKDEVKQAEPDESDTKPPEKRQGWRVKITAFSAMNDFSPIFENTSEKSAGEQIKQWLENNPPEFHYELVKNGIEVYPKLAIEEVEISVRVVKKEADGNNL